MKEDTIVQFVSFETKLNSEAFIIQWHQFQGVMNGDGHATVQQHELGNGNFKYISQHRCGSSLFQFMLWQEKRPPKIPRTLIRKRQNGGYIVLQRECTREPATHECRVLAFITNPESHLDSFRKIATQGKLNIYKAYYENCTYAYILEFFVRKEYSIDLLQQLNTLTSITEAGVYNECRM